MSLDNLQPAIGSVQKNIKRLGRGQGSGKGGTASRGHKGAKSRSGYSKKLGFEGGQMPLQRRVPKFGFKNINRKEYKGINIDTIQNLVESKKIKKSISIEEFIMFRLAGKNDLVKILGRGKIETALKISAHKFTASAKKAIQDAGGEAILV
ncbi:MAG: 50S ribosomal protein L15 [Flavobacteriaceae bacterium]|jgi:large subunit ribosomal protein L15|nr:50S ribosomal protein L15 [Flavobacteriaceae bacterium]|tara:strand:- start:170 stop:622 length:453 start_codon:yes stop_codon:yes gene_type:complete